MGICQLGSLPMRNIEFYKEPLEVQMKREPFTPSMGGWIGEDYASSNTMPKFSVACPQKTRKFWCTMYS